MKNHYYAKERTSKGTSSCVLQSLNRRPYCKTDASTKGLGACLLQDKKPIYFASKALTKMQRGYIAIEIESLTVPWAVEKFHHFLYRCHFILELGPKTT